MAGGVAGGGTVNFPALRDVSLGATRSEASVSDVRLVFAGSHLGSRALGTRAAHPARPVVVSNASGTWRQLGGTSEEISRTMEACASQNFWATGKSWTHVSEEPTVSSLTSPDAARAQRDASSDASGIDVAACWKRTAVEDALTLSRTGSAQSSAQRKSSALQSDCCLEPLLGEEENEEVARLLNRQGGSSAYYEAPNTDGQQPAGSAASSQASGLQCANDALVWGLGDDEVDVEHELSVKVKLIYAGGWSDSSGSEGHRTPPTPPPPASSSAANAAAAASARAQQVGGLDADHVEQFTVSFISDVQMHEDLAETSCLCTFCLDDMNVGEELCRLPCMHTFHRRCVHAWLERDRRCMLCRLDITRPRG